LDLTLQILHTVAQPRQFDLGYRRLSTQGIDLGPKVGATVRILSPQESRASSQRQGQKATEEYDDGLVSH
jgi:hypothetical protein